MNPSPSGTGPGRSSAVACAACAIGLLLPLLLLGGTSWCAAQPLPGAWGIEWTRTLDGSGADAATAVVMDAAGNVYVAGSTASADFPAPESLFDFGGGPVLGMDIFVAKFAPDGARLFVTTIGGSGDDIASTLALTPTGDLLVGGTTTSADFPVTGGSPPFQGGQPVCSDGFVVRLDRDGTGLEYAFYIGGTGDDAVTNLAVDSDGGIVLGGVTTSADLPVTADAWQPDRAGSSYETTDAFLARFRPAGESGSSLDYLTYIGGRMDDVATAVHPTERGSVWVVGATNSDDFPLVAPLQNTFAGPMRDREGDGWLARWDPNSGEVSFSTYVGGTQDDKPSAILTREPEVVYLIGTTRSGAFPGTEGLGAETSRGTADGFVSRLTDDGEPPTVAFTATITGEDNDIVAAAVDDPGTGTIWLAGSTRSQIFPAVEETSDLGGAGQDLLLVQLDAETQSPVQTLRIGGDGDEAATAVAASSGRVCAVGATRSPAFPGLEASAPTGEVSVVVCLSPGGTSRPPDSRARPTLRPNYPNPAGRATTVPLFLPRPGRVHLRLYDMLGRYVATIVDDTLPAGEHAVPVSTRSLAAGHYFVVLDAEGERLARSMVVIR